MASLATAFGLGRGCFGQREGVLQGTLVRFPLKTGGEPTGIKIHRTTHWPKLIGPARALHEMSMIAKLQNDFVVNAHFQASPFIVSCARPVRLYREAWALTWFARHGFAWTAESPKLVPTQTWWARRLSESLIVSLTTVQAML